MYPSNAFFHFMLIEHLQFHTNALKWGIGQNFDTGIPGLTTGPFTVLFIQLSYSILHKGSFYYALYYKASLNYAVHCALWSLYYAVLWSLYYTPVFFTMFFSTVKACKLSWLFCLTTLSKNKKPARRIHYKGTLHMP